METTLYGKIANQIIGQIRAGIFKPGEKLPSVRSLSRKRSVSISTILTAYGILEDQGLVEVRPKSGYYVRRVPVHEHRPPAISQRTSVPRKVATPQRVMEVMRDSSSPQFISFAAALPGTDFPVIHQLKRIFARVIRSAPFLGIGYDSPKGSEPLRRQVARRALDAGILCSPEEIITTAGCQSAIGLCLRALTSAGDIIAVETPCYYGLLQQIEAYGLKAIEIPSDAERGMSIDALRLAFEQWPIKVVLSIPSYSNPLGALMPSQHKQQLVSLIEQYDVPMIEDDIYGELGYQDRRPPAVKSFDRHGRVLLCSSTSKTLEPQLGVGWVIPGRYQEQIEYQKFINSVSISRLPQLAVAEMLDHGGYDRHLRLARESYRQRRDRLIDLVGQYFPGETRISRPQGGFVAWIQLPRGASALQLYLDAREEGILISPGELFSANSGKYQSSIRLTYSDAWTASRIEAVKTLGELVARQL
ncbi:MAG: PLP-dependent aminotransferase family protein [Gammaproteobacteria bacterium]|nr:PLP-dependent aminotransferase family protein [Gammaproteobacteria bacterium]